MGYPFLADHIPLTAGIVRFWAANLPDAAMLAVGGPFALAWAAASLMFAGYLKSHGKFKTGYTRKIFHFIIFGTVVVIHEFRGSRGVCLFGGMTSLVIAYAVFKGSGHPMYEALAREKDRPRRTYYIVVPYCATLLGGLLSNILFPATAPLGYLVTGLGDAVAEPVGTRFGRHEYKVPAFGGVRAIRSLEGSCAVFMASALSLTAYFVLAHPSGLSGRALVAVVLIASIATLVEAVSPHGWDNATLQVVPALLGAWLL